MKKYLLLPLVVAVIAGCNKQEPQTAEPTVKKSNSAGICHDKNSGSYDRLKDFTAFNSMDACIKSGGTLPKNYQEEEQQSASNSSSPSKEYEREFFGHGWTDSDKDCMNTRHEILLAHAVKGTAKNKEGDNCQIAVGEWKSPFTDNIITSASAIDIDHIAPLKFAWTYGAETWSEDKRVQFANDPENLLAVEASLNRSKGAQDITEWLPPANKCEYITNFLKISDKYGLVFPQDKQTAFETVRQTHCS